MFDAIMKRIILQKNTMIFRILFVLATCLQWSIFCKAQPAVQITYNRWFNDKPAEGQPATVVFANKKQTIITNEKILAKQSALPYEQIIFYPGENKLVTIGFLNSNETAAMSDTASIGKQKIELLPDTKTILGRLCKKAKTIVNSNTIELWYADGKNIFAAPSALGIKLGIVLEMVRNGNSITRAVDLKDISTIPSNAVPAIPEFTDELSYKDKLWRSRFKTISVFDNDTIHFTKTEKWQTGAVYKFANGTVILKKIKYPEIKPGSLVFVEAKQQSNGDAYDRTGSVFIIPADREKTFFEGMEKGKDVLPIYTSAAGKNYQGVAITENFLPPLELMRFYTPFGINKYNYLKLKDKPWQEVARYRQEVSALAPALSGKEVWTGMFIGNYDGGGHKVSLEVTIHNNDDEENFTGKKKVLSLFNTVNVLEMAGQNYGSMFDDEKGLQVTFTLAKELVNAKLRFISTGHGGWGGGDEFVPKLNTIVLDGREMFSFIPWREDCGSYRLYNPASGNFGNGLSSSDYSRSNWCPGTVTNPISVLLGKLSSGTHTLQIKIPQGKPEGSSFSYWNVSGVLIGDE